MLPSAEVETNGFQVDASNSINDTIRAGVMDDTPNLDFLRNAPESSIPQNATQHEIVVQSNEEVESAAETEHQDDDANANNDEIEESDEGDAEAEINADDHARKMSVGKRADEDADNQEHQDGDANVDSDEISETNEGDAEKESDVDDHDNGDDPEHVTRSGRPQCCNEVNVVQKLFDGVFCS